MFLFKGEISCFLKRAIIAYHNQGGLLVNRMSSRKHHQRWKRCEVPTSSTSEVTQVDGVPAVRFHPCGVTSFNSKDIEYRYCALCHEFIPNEYESPMDTLQRLGQEWDNG